MYKPIRPLLFRLEPERANALTIFALQVAGAPPLLTWAVHRKWKLQE
ncbi:MAG: hypothetical protein Q8K73_04840 [Anaerolineales bacterium]|nr:hypothetical protein [Anaerolineales bacterium]